MANAEEACEIYKRRRYTREGCTHREEAGQEETADYQLQYTKTAEKGMGIRLHVQVPTNVLMGSRHWDMFSSQSYSKVLQYVGPGIHLVQLTELYPTRLLSLPLESSGLVLFAAGQIQATLTSGGRFKGCRLGRELLRMHVAFCILLTLGDL